MRRFKVNDSIKTSGRRVCGWLSCIALLGMFSLSGCDVFVEDDDPAVIDGDDDPDVIEVPDDDPEVIEVPDDDADLEIDAPNTHIDVDPD